MKITDTQGIGKAGTIKKKTRTEGGGDFGALIGGEEETATTASIAGLSPVASLAGLLAVQEATSELETIQRRIEQGHELLDSLDQLRLGLLEGRISATTTKRLADQLRQEKSIVSDPQLLDILEDIDTRAQVELAKLEVATQS